MNGDVDIQYLENQLEANPDSLLFARLADAYLQDQQLERATELCEEGTKKHPYYVTGHLILGKCYLASKQYDQAEKEFKRVLLFDQKYLAAHKLYGDLMQEIGWENTCENSYKKILQIDPLDENIRARLGELSSQSGATPQVTPDLPHGENVELPKDTEDDLESVAPLPLTSDEEEMLFEGETPEREDQDTKLESTTSDKEEVDTEKFSSILDDIFKDEVVKEEETPTTSSMDIYSSEEDLVSDIQKEPEKYFEDDEVRDEQIPAIPSPTEPEMSDDIDFEQAPESAPEVSAEASDPGPPASDSEKPPAEETLPDREAARKQPPETAPRPTAEEATPTSPPEASQKADRDKIVTPTLGEIYAAQGQYSKALNVFELLLTKHPDNEDFATKIEQLKEKLADAGNASKA